MELIAPCLPGAQLEEVGNDEYKGFVKVKVGPITAQYKGVAKFIEVDDSNHRVVIRGEGRDTRGAGNAAADITASLESVPEGTCKCCHRFEDNRQSSSVRSRVMADISKKLMGQFADNLSELVLSEDSKPASTGSEGSELEETEAIDLLSVAGGSIGKKLVPEWIKKPTKEDLVFVTESLGRKPEGLFEVAVRDEAGNPRVIRNYPLLPNGKPMPTMYWLVDPLIRSKIGTLESQGGVKQAEKECDPKSIAEAHDRYRKERDHQLPDSHSGPKPSGELEEPAKV